MKTTLVKTEENKRQWYVVDAEGKALGRLAVKIADVLRGKDKPTFAPHMDNGDFVVVVNAKKVLLTGNKDSKKIYQRYSGYRGGLKEIPASQMRKRHPERMIELAVKGMLPHNNLSRRSFRRLKVYADMEHPHGAHPLQPLELS